jgi:hypothetical protein
MGNFLVIVAPAETRAEAGDVPGRLFLNGQAIKEGKPNGLVETDWVKAISYARLNGSGASITEDPESKSWLITTGTWFHSDGFASGDESRLLARIISCGPERTAKELEGFFVLVYGDARTREVIVITDVIASCHCFFRTIGNCCAISTSSLQLARLAECSLDLIACEEYLRTGVVYENRTFFREVKKIGPARIARFAGGKPVSENRYWSIRDLDPNKLDGSQAVSELAEKLVGAAKNIGRVFPVCDLTGGYDSRLIVAAFISAGVNFETTVAGSSESGDCIVSGGLSKITGIPHWQIEYETRYSYRLLKEALRLTDGGYDVIDYARIYSLHSRLSSKFDMSVNGSFGELARGCWWEMFWPHIGKREPFDARKIASHRYVVDPSSPQLFSAETGVRDFIGHITQIIEQANSGLSGWPNTAKMDNTYLELRMQYWQGRIASSTDQIWPCLSPFMLRSVLETILQIRARLRHSNLLVRIILEKLQPELAAYPFEPGYFYWSLPLTWRTLPQFLPALISYGRKSKAASKLLGRRPRQSATPNLEAIRLQIWREPEVYELLDPGRMRLRELIEVNRLRPFLNASQEAHFRYDQQWNRVLSLEMALAEVGNKC